MKNNFTITSPKGAIAISGGLQIYQAEAARDALLREVSSRSALVLDLGGVTECDLAGVQLIWAIRKTAEESGKLFHIEQASPAFLSCCERLGLRTDDVLAPLPSKL